MRPFDITRDEDLYVEGYCSSFEESFPGVMVTEALRATYRDSLAQLESAPGVSAFTIDNALNNPVGFIVLSVGEADALRQVSVDVLFVNEGYRRQGFAKRLLEQAARLAEEHSAVTIRLDVSAGNEPALRLYESLGYKITRFQMERAGAA